jgi:hypothetical protein
VIKTGRFRWLVQLFRMQKLDTCIRLTDHKPQDIRRLGKPELRWRESIEDIGLTEGCNATRREEEKGGGGGGCGGGKKKKKGGGGTVSVRTFVI